MVDDDGDLRDAARMTLEDSGYEAIEAPNGQVALDELRTSAEPLVVQMDMVMPRASGIDVLERVDAEDRLARHAYVLWSASRVPLPPNLDGLALLSMPKPFETDHMLDVIAEASEQLREERGA